MTPFPAAVEQRGHVASFSGVRNKGAKYHNKGARYPLVSREISPCRAGGRGGGGVNPQAAHPSRRGVK
jgi:hypothetical protein